ncbi:MAG: hypothetical protein EOP04_13575 [Proteobacteria bacterium]|nr:MAG: hypothetical protein EOP04_13575 [Pseudomonadota bacterium]
MRRLSKTEATDPAYAISQYRQFLVGRQITPSVGVQAALKVTQLRQQIKDFKGASLTSKIFAKKFVEVPVSVLLRLEEARALQSQGQLTQSSMCVNESMTQLLALGPSYYAQVSDTLLQLANISLSKGPQGVSHACGIYNNVERIYFEWLKGGTIPHTWQRFEALQTSYQQAGDQRQASELLTKAAAVLVAMPPSKSNPEGADVSVMAARWLSDHGNAEAAQELYAKAPAYGNSFVAQVALTDQGQQLLAKGLPQAALDLMIKNSPQELAFGPQWVVALAYWQLEDWPKAEEALSKVVHIQGSDAIRATAQSRLALLQQWKNKAFNLPLCNLLSQVDANGKYHTTLYVHSLGAQSIEVLFSDTTVQLNTLALQQQKRTDSGVLVAVYDLSYATLHPKDSVEAFVQLKDQPATAQRIQLQERQEQKDE